MQKNKKKSIAKRMFIGTTVAAITAGSFVAPMMLTKNDVRTNNIVSKLSSLENSSQIYSQRNSVYSLTSGLRAYVPDMNKFQSTKNSYFEAMRRHAERAVPSHGSFPRPNVYNGKSITPVSKEVQEKNMRSGKYAPFADVGQLYNGQLYNSFLDTINSGETTMFQMGFITAPNFGFRDESYEPGTENPNTQVDDMLRGLNYNMKDGNGLDRSPNFDIPSMVGGSLFLDYPRNVVTSWWNNQTGGAEASDLLSDIRRRGADYMFSIGGWRHNTPGLVVAKASSFSSAHAQKFDEYYLAAMYAYIIDALDLNFLDFDLEGTDSLDFHEASIEDTIGDYDPSFYPSANDSIKARELRMKAIKILKSSPDYKDVSISFTLPIMQNGFPDGILNMLVDGINTGVVDRYNIMTMDFSNQKHLTVPGEMALFAISAINNAIDQIMAHPNNFIKDRFLLARYLGVTPMMGKNDVPNEVFWITDAILLSAWAIENGLGYIGSWVHQRDYQEATNIAKGISDLDELLITLDGKDLAKPLTTLYAEFGISEVVSGIGHKDGAFSSIFNRVANGEQFSVADIHIPSELIDSLKALNVGINDIDDIITWTGKFNISQIARLDNELGSRHNDNFGTIINNEIKLNKDYYRSSSSTVSSVVDSYVESVINSPNSFWNGGPAIIVERGKLYAKTGGPVYLITRSWNSDNMPRNIAESWPNGSLELLPIWRSETNTKNGLGLLTPWGATDVQRFSNVLSRLQSDNFSLPSDLTIEELEEISSSINSNRLSTIEEINKFGNDISQVFPNVNFDSLISEFKDAIRDSEFYGHRVRYNLQNKFNLSIVYDDDDSRDFKVVTEINLNTNELTKVTNGKLQASRNETALKVFNDNNITSNDIMALNVNMISSQNYRTSLSIDDFSISPSLKRLIDNGTLATTIDISKSNSTVSLRVYVPGSSGLSSITKTFNTLFIEDFIVKSGNWSTSGNPMEIKPVYKFDESKLLAAGITTVPKITSQRYYPPSKNSNWASVKIETKINGQDVVIFKEFRTDEFSSSNVAAHISEIDESGNYISNLDNASLIFLGNNSTTTNPVDPNKNTNTIIENVLGSITQSGSFTHSASSLEAAFSKTLTNGTLNFWLPSDLQGTRVTYSHSALDKDQNGFNVQVKVELNGQYKTRNFLIDVNGIDKFNVDQVANSFASNSYFNVTNATKIDAVTTDTPFTHHYLNINLPSNLRGSRITYTHQSLNADGNLVVRVKVEKNGQVAFKNITVAVTGLNGNANNKAIDDVLGSITQSGAFTHSASSLEAAFSKTLTNGTLNFWLPSDLQGTRVTYSHSALDKDQNGFNVQVKVELNGQYKTRNFLIDVNGIDKFNVDQVANSFASNSYFNVTNATKIDAVTTETPFTHHYLNINLPSNLRGSRITYTHQSLNADGNLVVRVKVEKNGQVAFKNITVAVTGLNGNANNKAIDDVLGSITQSGAFTHSASSLEASFGKTLTNGTLNFWLPSDLQGTRVTYSHSALDKDQNGFNVQVKVELNGQYKTRNFLIDVNGIDKFNVDQVANSFASNSFFNVTNATKIDAVTTETPLTNRYLNINLPSNLRGSRITYTHQSLNADGNLVVRVKVEKNGQVAFKNITVAVTGLNGNVNNKTIDDVLGSITQSGAFTHSASSLEASFGKTLTNGTLNFWLPSDLQGTRVTYSHSALDKDENGMRVQVKVELNGQYKIRNFFIDVNGIDKFNVNQVANSFASNSFFNVTNATKIDAVTTETPLTNHYLNINLPSNLRGSRITYTHQSLNADGNLVVRVKVEKNGQVAFKNITVAVTGLNGSVDPTDPTTKPVDPTDPTTKPVDPTDPTTKPVDPVDPVDPNNQTGATKQTTPKTNSSNGVNDGLLYGLMGVGAFLVVASASFAIYKLKKK